MHFKRYLSFLILAVCLIPSSVKAYSVLTHEAIIDASWEKSIKPLLKKRFPDASEAELRLAHSYAYGGSLMTDIGYSPFGSTYFTNLIHYVRSGDFVNNLISESDNLNEFAYAVGALCHYMADRYGHSVGTNIVVPMTYPKVKRKFGDIVTYEQKPIAHSRVEIAFDVLQIARGNYASQAYHDFIGFNVAKPVLEKAFLKTYGQDLNQIFPNLDRSVNNFRWAINSLMPTVTRSAWVLKKDEIKKNEPGITGRKFHYRMRRKQYFEEFGRDLDKPKFKERLIAFFINIAPKVGPLRVFRFRPVSPAGEKQFIKSFDTVMEHYAVALAQLDYKQPHLPNVDFDTGKLTAYGEYELTDQTYDSLVEKLNDNKLVDLTAPLKKDIIGFYSKADTAALAKNNPSAWKKTGAGLYKIEIAIPRPLDSLKFTNKVNNKDTVIHLSH
ncbi:zinc dependent phospholipase C family protein [Mucilaginibacter sp. UR6-11]|uniref:zinc dependent phospholipase C family protein n=1 Tax=Mucilaginibacter sp. UR6-11 TaxID=1435644 RepID=UPI001E443A5B|nr:zinc dependent phospholipase C family protein [Mucilaginibacter sp. UR6-11]MCC8424057.1 zinc dependent phospholipase C family protein [Mucilaginibacter sp. UR6-11]